MKKLTIISFSLLVGLALPYFGQDKSLPAEEKQKIETLIAQVAALKDATFIRNGAGYNVTTAVTFLQVKWLANAAKVKTAREFIDNVASMSGMARPYLIRLKNERPRFSPRRAEKIGYVMDVRTCLRKSSLHSADKRACGIVR